MEHYEEFTETKQVWGWLSIAALSIFVLGWGMCLMMLVTDVERRWDYNITPIAPSQSISTVTSSYEENPDQIQIQKLPEAQPLKNKEKPGYEVIHRGNKR